MSLRRNGIVDMNYGIIVSLLRHYFSLNQAYSIDYVKKLYLKIKKPLWLTDLSQKAPRP
jgi:hypothetical protein